MEFFPLVIEKKACTSGVVGGDRLLPVMGEDFDQVVAH